MKVCPATHILEVSQHVGSGATSAAQWGSRWYNYLTWVAWALKLAVLLTKEENSLCIHQWPQFQKRALAGRLLQHILVGNYSCGCPMWGLRVGDWRDSPAQREEGRQEALPWRSALPAHKGSTDAAKLSALKELWHCLPLWKLALIYKWNPCN